MPKRTLGWARRLGVVLGAVLWSRGGAAQERPQSSASLQEGLVTTAEVIAQGIDALPGDQLPGIMDIAVILLEPEAKGLSRELVDSMRALDPQVFANTGRVQWTWPEGATGPKPARCREALAPLDRREFAAVLCVSARPGTDGGATMAWELRTRADTRGLLPTLRGPTMAGEARLSGAGLVGQPRSVLYRHSWPMLSAGAALSVGGGVLAGYTYYRYLQDEATIWSDMKRTFDEPWVASNTLGGSLALAGASLLVLEKLVYHPGGSRRVVAVLDAGDGSVALALGGAF